MLPRIFNFTWFFTYLLNYQNIYAFFFLQDGRVSRYSRRSWRTFSIFFSLSTFNQFSIIFNQLKISSLKMLGLAQLTPSWRGKWRPSGTWWTATWRSSPRRAGTSCPKSSCISWSTTPNPSSTESSSQICTPQETRWELMSFRTETSDPIWNICQLLFGPRGGNSYQDVLLQCVVT